MLKEMRQQGLGVWFTLVFVLAMPLSKTVLGGDFEDEVPFSQGGDSFHNAPLPPIGVEEAWTFWSLDHGVGLGDFRRGKTATMGSLDTRPLIQEYRTSIRFDDQAYEAFNRVSLRLTMFNSRDNGVDYRDRRPSYSTHGILSELRVERCSIVFGGKRAGALGILYGLNTGSDWYEAQPRSGFREVADVFALEDGIDDMSFFGVHMGLVGLLESECWTITLQIDIGARLYQITSSARPRIDTKEGSPFILWGNGWDWNLSVEFARTIASSFDLFFGVALNQRVVTLSGSYDHELGASGNGGFWRLGEVPPQDAAAEHSNVHVWPPIETGLPPQLRFPRYRLTWGVLAVGLRWQF